VLLAGSWGLVIVFLNVLVEQAGLPVPAVPTLLVAGALAMRHPSWGTLSFLLATLACVLADFGWYLAGRRYGDRIMRLLCRVSLSPDSCVGNTQRRFERWGRKSLIAAKFVPGLSTIAPPLAGALHMRGAEFLALSAFGSALWAATFLGLGALAAPTLLALLPWIAHRGGQALLVVLPLLLGYILVKWWQRRRFYASVRSARIEAPELYAMLRANRSPAIVDVRTHLAQSLDPRIIPGALHVPPDQIEAKLSGLERQREIVVYCNCPNEASAAKIAKLLIDRGFARVRPLHGGLDGWAAAGYPLNPATQSGT
jgi:membrane protein DedA with SNARE-associated domain/rhodanese-related sulfurtransferase